MNHMALYKVLVSKYGKCHNRWPELEFRCPFCHDSGGKRSHYFSVNIYKGKYNCWLCGEHGNLEWLIGNDIAIPNSFFDRLNLEDAQFEGTKISSFDISKWELLDWDSKDSKHTTAINFMGRRGFPKDPKTNLFVSNEEHLKYRVIFPVYHDEVLEFYTARSIFSHIALRYLNPRIERKEFLYIPYYEPYEYRVCVLTEGVMDALSVPGKLGIALLSSKVTQEQTEYIAQNFDHVIICLDGDSAGREGTIYTANRLSKWVSDVKVLILPFGSDVNDLYVKNKFTKLSEFGILYQWAPLAELELLKIMKKE